MSADESGDNKATDEIEFINLPHDIYREALNEIIKNNCDISNDQCDVLCSAGSSKGDNYIGVVYRVCVRNKEDNSIKLNLIVKLPPQNAARREQFFVRPAFEREIDFYENLYPIYKKFQMEKGIAADDGFYHIPFCYKTLLDAPYEALYFDDLKAQGFEMFDRFQNVTCDQVLLVMRSLAKLHACFFSIKDQQPHLIESYRELDDLFLLRKGEENMNVWFENVKKQARDTIAESKNEDLVKRIDDLLSSNFFELMEQCVDRKIAEPYAIMTHGDCWNNNIMYKYDESGKPVDIRLLDFQIMRYASPVCDLMYYIFGCTTKPLRDKHYQEFMDVYYETLTDYIKRLGSDPEKLFPRAAFEDHLKRFGKFGFIMAMMVLPIFTSVATDIPDMDEIAEKFKEAKESGETLDTAKFVDFKSFSTANVYAQRMSDVIEDMYYLGYI